MSSRLGAPLVRVLVGIAIVVVVSALTFLLRGSTIGYASTLNPDEAELIGQARAAMRSIVPFTTWTTSTTGPVWVYFLAILGWAGVPMTITGAHAIAAILVGVMGGLAFLLFARSSGIGAGALLAVFWWLPLALVLPLGNDTVDFGALNTELLPGVLVLAAALVSRAMLTRSILWFGVSGLLCGLAVASKYQILPIALGLLFAQLALCGWRARGSVLRRIVVFGGSAAIPFVLTGIAMLVTPTVSRTLIEQNVNFLAAYGRVMAPAARIDNTLDLFQRGAPVLLMFFIALMLIWRSPVRFGVARIVLVIGTITAVLAGGQGFGHYLILAWIGFPLIVALPYRRWSLPGERALRARAVGLGVVAFVTAWSLCYGLQFDDVRLTTPAVLAGTASREAALRDASLAAECPSRSGAAVWGWAPQLYSIYDWTSTNPLMNTYLITITDRNRDSGEALMRSVISDSRTHCVFDAIGSPFFATSTKDRLLRIYPALAPALADAYTAHSVRGCRHCTVWVRRP